MINDILLPQDVPPFTGEDADQVAVVIRTCSYLESANITIETFDSVNDTISVNDGEFYITRYYGWRPTFFGRVVKTLMYMVSVTVVKPSNNRMEPDDADLKELVSGLLNPLQAAAKVVLAKTENELNATIEEILRSKEQEY